VAIQVQETRQVVTKGVNIVDYVVVDSIEDITSLPSLPDVGQGSTAFVISDSTTYMLNGSGIWEEVQKCGWPGGGCGVGVSFRNTVAAYSMLPTVGIATGDTWLVAEDANGNGMFYTYGLTGWPPQGQGATFPTVPGPPGPQGPPGNDGFDPLNPVFNSNNASETATLGPELISASDWVSNGWTGSYSAGFQNTTGNTSPLKWNGPIVAGKRYLVSFNSSTSTPAPSNTATMTITLGGAPTTQIYKGSVYLYAFGFTAFDTSGLVITPYSAYDGIISNISIKEVIGPSIPVLSVINSTGAVSFEIRPSLPSLNNLFIGKNAGKFQVSQGDQNVGIGYNALSSTIASFWNTAIGANALAANTTGTRNAAIGYNTLQANMSGHYNVAIGNFAMAYNETGKQNIAIGSDAMWNNKYGDKNIAIGSSVMSNSNTTASDNIAIGASALRLTQYNQQVAIGSYSLFSAQNSTGPCVAIGYQTMYEATNPNYCDAVGYVAQYHNHTCINNVSFGSGTLYMTQTGSNNTCVGKDAGRMFLTGDRNVAVGTSAGRAGNTTADMSDNVFIGFETGKMLVNSSNQNVIIGSSTASNLTTGSGNIYIGYNILASSSTISNELNIGNILKGDLSTKNLSLQGGLNAASLPTIDPHIVGQVWANSGVLTVSAG